MSFHEPLLSMSGAGRRLDSGDHWLFRNVELAVSAGQRIAISGRSGAGKTVLLRSLVLLDPLDEGQVLWGGKSLARDAIPTFRGEVVYLHQAPALVAGTVEDNLRLPFTLRSHGRKSFDREQAVRTLEHCGRQETFLDKVVRDLSGGEAQLVALTRALLVEPTILLLDEPTAALDSETTQAVEELLVGWLARRAEARAYLWICHDEAQRRRIADSHWIVDDGSLHAGEGS